MKSFISFFISLGYFGYLKPGSGTIGTAISIIILFPIFILELVSYNILIISLAVLIIFSIYFIKLYSQFTNQHDSSEIVIDEFIGVYLIFIFYNNIFIINHYFSIILIFFIFRFFDIFKLFPANIIDKSMKNSLGVILDDIIASIYTILTLIFVNAVL